MYRPPLPGVKISRPCSPATMGDSTGCLTPLDCHAIMPDYASSDERPGTLRGNGPLSIRGLGPEPKAPVSIRRVEDQHDHGAEQRQTHEHRDGGVRRQSARRMEAKASGTNLRSRPVHADRQRLPRADALQRRQRLRSDGNPCGHDDPFCQRRTILYGRWHQHVQHVHAGTSAHGHEHPDEGAGSAHWPLYQSRCQSRSQALRLRRGTKLPVNSPVPTSKPDHRCASS